MVHYWWVLHDIMSEIQPCGYLKDHWKEIRATLIEVIDVAGLCCHAKIDEHWYKLTEPETWMTEQPRRQESIINQNK